MLNPSHIGLSAALFFCYSIAHAESTTNKCTDGEKITYANMPCEKLGLKSIGPVKDAIVVVPAIQQSKPVPSENPDKTRGEKNETSEEIAPQAVKIKPVTTLIGKLLH